MPSRETAGARAQPEMISASMAARGPQISARCGPLIFAVFWGAFPRFANRSPYSKSFLVFDQKTGTPLCGTIRSGKLGRAISARPGAGISDGRPARRGAARRLMRDGSAQIGAADGAGASSSVSLYPCGIYFPFRKAVVCFRVCAVWFRSNRTALFFRPPFPKDRRCRRR